MGGPLTGIRYGDIGSDGCDATGGQQVSTEERESTLALHEPSPSVSIPLPTLCAEFSDCRHPVQALEIIVRRSLRPRAIALAVVAVGAFSVPVRMS